MQRERPFKRSLPLSFLAPLLESSMRLPCAASIAVFFVGTACAPVGGSTDGGMKAGDGGLLPAGPTAPRVDQAALHVAGRFGADLFLSLSGFDPNADAQKARVTFQTAAGAPVKVFDLDHDDVPESAEGPVALTTAIDGKQAFASTAHFPGLALAQPGLARATVVVLDRGGLPSAPVTATLTAQVMRAHGDGCDPALVLDRCPADQGCKGTPPVCADGEAPKVERAGYYKDPNGPHTLVELSDKDSDADHVRADFFDAAGKAVSVDTNNDGSPDTTGFDFTAVATLGPQAFLLTAQSGQGFDDLVKRLVLTPFDRAGHAGVPVTVNLSDPPVRAIGQPCSPNGLDRCAGGGVCAEGGPGTFTCLALLASRTKSCGSAPVLGPTTGIYSVVGVTAPASMWDPPAGCSPQDPKGRPEGVALLKLTAPAQSVTLTTARPGTTFDTVLSVFASCAATTALSCNDDGPSGSTSTLTLSNVAAGTYVVVVDSWNAAGGAWELLVTVN